ncbi:hypothetical protein L3X38_001739 [Prunus dulcis]|uniref:Glucose-methanol-choline oxidoreductase N-terminal domain-containing protein n=1 Tax=Prunus dulcis TaxID=3755 RepID=A0AAD4WUN0_PRUDU|nr:hypothetical protein L3X38_001739 [Prunus dulcis]
MEKSRNSAFVRGKGEVILSAGTIGSPQLLLLSGVGPKSYLSSIKIPVVHHEPNCPRYCITILPPSPLVPSGGQTVSITKDFYIETLAGPPFSSTPFSLFPHPYVRIKIDSTFGHIVGKFPGPSSYGSLTLQS